MTFWTALRKEMMEQWRSYRLLVVGVVFLVFGLASPLLAKYTPEMLKLAIPEGMGEALANLIPKPTIGDAVGQYLKNLSQFGILLALLMTMGAVAQEKDKGTAALILTKPLSRGAFVAAKFVALGVTFAVGTLLAAVAGYYYTLLLFGRMDLVAWLSLNGLLLVSLLVYVALTLLCSTVTKSQVVAGGLALGILILGSALGAWPKAGNLLPGKLSAWASSLFVGAPATPAPAWPALWVSLGLIVTAVVGSWILLERQEL